MSKTWTFKADNLFEDIPGDDNNVNMTIPPEILKEKGSMKMPKLKNSNITIGDLSMKSLKTIKEKHD